MSSLVYFIKQALQGFTRNLSTTLGSIITIFLSLFIIGVFLVGAIVIDNIVKSVEGEVSITAYVDDNAKQSDIDAMETYIQGINGVASVSFTRTGTRTSSSPTGSVHTMRNSSPPQRAAKPFVSAATRRSASAVSLSA